MKRSIPLIAAIFLSGCVTWQGAPTSRQTPEEGSLYQSIASRITEATKLVEGCAGDLECATTARDEHIRRTMLLIDIHYLNYIRQVSVENGQVNFGIDTAISVLATAGTFTFGGQTNELLSAGTSILNSGRSSYSRSALSEADVFDLISIMETQRAEVSLRLRAGMLSDTYTIDATNIDLLAYFHAGTLVGARYELARQIEENLALTNRAIASTERQIEELEQDLQER